MYSSMFDAITTEMINQMDGINRSQYEKLTQCVGVSENLSADFVYNLSELANSLAIKSHTTSMEYKIALPLCDLIDTILGTKRNGSTFAITYQQELSDAKIDLYYAAGNRQFASSRMATFLMSMQYYNQDAMQTPLAPGIRRFA